MEVKKNPKIALKNKYILFLNIGLVISLLIITLAFEWKSYPDSDLLHMSSVTDDFVEMTEIPITNQPPPVVKIKLPEIIEVEDEEEIKEEISIDLDVEITEETEIEVIVFAEPMEEEVADEIFTLV